MADTPISDSSFLDLEGLTKYNEKIKSELEKKVNAEPGKKLTTNDFDNDAKEKLQGLTQYILPVTSKEEIGGVKIEVTEDVVPQKAALKSDATGTAYVDWKEAPQASESVLGLMKIGKGLKLGEDGSVEVDGDHVSSGEIEWSDIKDAPDFALKSDLTDVYKYKGSVGTYEDLFSMSSSGAEVGDVYNVTDTDMNYAWTGSVWDPLGSTFSISRITDDQIDKLFED